MEILCILLSSRGAGETLFAGTIIGLITWGWMTLRDKTSETKQEKQDFANLMLLKEAIVNKGRLSVVKKNFVTTSKRLTMLRLKSMKINVLIIRISKHNHNT